MTEEYYFFNSTATDRRRHQASDMADYWMSFLSSGLIHEDGQPQLEVVADGTSRNVTLSIGRALLRGHLYINDDDLNKMIDGPDATLDRIDRLVLRYDNTIEERSIKSFIIKGVEAENPEPPELTREGDIYEISLAQIRVVAGKAFVEQSDIIDERLDESVCGLSSSLVTVPTDIYNREFREMLEAMRGEWLEWYDSIVKDTYVTNTTYYDDRRDTDRQLANLNAIADIDSRAIGNTGKFYDFFDGTNEYSEAKLDEAKTVLLFDVEEGDNRITVESVAHLRVGNEYTLVGLENLNSLETITRTILIKDILPNNVIELVDDLDTNLIAGGYLLRSNFIDNEFVHEFFVESWATVQKIKELTGRLLQGHAVTRDAFPTMLITTDANGMIMQDVNKIKEYEDDDTLAGEFRLSGQLRFSRSVYLSNHERYIIGYSDTSEYIRTGIHDKQTGIEISAPISTPLVRDVGSNRRHLVDIIDLDGEEYILISGFGHYVYEYEVRDGILKIGKIDNGNFVYLSTEEQNYILGEDFPKLRATNIFTTGKNHLFIMPPGEPLMEYKADGDKIKFVKAHEFRFISDKFQVSDIFMNGELLQLATFGTSKKPRSDRDIAILRYVDGEYQELSVPFRSDLTLVTGGADRRTLFDGEALYDFDGEGFTLIQDFKDKVNHNYVEQGFVFYDYVFIRTASGYDVYTKDGTNVTIDDLVLRYNFNNPVKNIATWIDFENYEKDVEVYLSNVEEGEQETFERLPVAVRDNEAEALKVNNVFEKPRNALKLIVPSENGIKKILGAIE